jgi:hypothetical protein
MPDGGNDILGPGEDEVFQKTYYTDLIFRGN